MLQVYLRIAGEMTLKRFEDCGFVKTGLYLCIMKTKPIEFRYQRSDVFGFDHSEGNLKRNTHKYCLDEIMFVYMIESQNTNHLIG